MCFFRVSFRPPHPHRDPLVFFSTHSSGQSTIRFSRVKSGLTQPKKQVLRWCPESAAAAGFVATAESASCRWQPGALARPLSKIQSNSCMATPLQLCNRMHRKVLGLGVNTPHHCFHAPFFFFFCHFFYLGCANTRC